MNTAVSTMQDKVEILGSQISVWNLEETCDKLCELASTKTAHYVCVSNVHTVVTGTEDQDYQKITNTATLATADGVPLIWASKLLHSSPIHGRASGPDILMKLLIDKKYAHYKHFFYGSTPEVLSSLRQSIERMNTSATIVGYLSPPLRKPKSINDPLTNDERADIEEIKKSEADFIWVGLGAPKQEIWMYRAVQSFSHGVLLGVGAAFDFLSGNKKRAPLWMQKAGLEWAHRMLSEPKRLTGRYLSTNPKFVLDIFKQFLKR